jgi:NAD(P)-dependent dehydrogenase (short-subunit alcohol dehydrogenase family)
MNTNSNTEKLVLVTGGAGFIAMHCMIRLLNGGYRVRATLGSLDREAKVRAMLREGGVEAGNRLTFIKAGLSADEHWDEAVKGCTWIAALRLSLTFLLHSKNILVIILLIRGLSDRHVPLKVEEMCHHKRKITKNHSGS